MVREKLELFLQYGKSQQYDKIIQLLDENCQIKLLNQCIYYGINELKNYVNFNFLHENNFSDIFSENNIYCVDTHYPNKKIARIYFYFDIMSNKIKKIYLKPVETKLE